MYIYRWLNNFKARQGDTPKELKSLPQIHTKDDWAKKIHPGKKSNLRVHGVPSRLAGLLLTREMVEQGYRHLQISPNRSAPII